MRERLQELAKRASRPVMIGLTLAGLRQSVFAEGQTQDYVVKPNDTLSKIAMNYLGLTWQEICAANNIPDCNLIHPGQKLVIPTGTRSNKAAWPETPVRAAATFGGIPERWEPTADPGGWHLREEAERTIINPSGYPLEGYYDTKPGRDPRQFVSTVAIEVQGCTVWRDATPEQLFCAMVAQKYPGLSYNQVRSLIDAVGFTKPVSCRRE